eukprot:scaffold803_cov310-Pinguiococcus_pyrenoidosus.AAC.138
MQGPKRPKKRTVPSSAVPVFTHRERRGVRAENDASVFHPARKCSRFRLRVSVLASPALLQALLPVVRLCLRAAAHDDGVEGLEWSDQMRWPDGPKQERSKT